MQQNTKVTPGKIIALNGSPIRTVRIGGKNWLVSMDICRAFNIPPNHVSVRKRLFKPEEAKLIYKKEYPELLEWPKVGSLLLVAPSAISKISGWFLSDYKRRLDALPDQLSEQLKVQLKKKMSPRLLERSQPDDAAFFF